MEEYIKKSAVVTEIDRIKKEECPTDTYEGRCKLLWFEQFLSFLNTIEGKEVIAGQECICNGVFNKIIGSSWNLTIPLDKVGLKHGDKVEVLIIKR